MERFMGLVTAAPKRSRRGLLAVSGGAVTACGIANLTQAMPGPRQDARSSNAGFEKIQKILDVRGKVKHGLLHLEIDRKDIKNVTLRGVPVKPDFQLNGDLYFQDLGNKEVVMNGDFPLKAKELDSFIKQLVSNDLIVQAEHQHLYDFSPMVWFVHFRGQGNPEKLAHGIKAAYNVTSAPFPQKPPSNPTTPLPHEQMSKIIGADADLGEDGVVHFDVPRQESITLGGTKVSPYLNVAATIAFQPHGGGQGTAAVVDFAMVASEINKVMSVMLELGWDMGCLYNQETDEHPQLYFSHQFKTGDALQLAKEIRKGLQQTNSKLQSS